ncbi:MAG: sigma-70 family RNA polymerase sigma factor [Desulfomonilaceae bacterium]|nr:sigma-70 family RNA polymerase sigma factor [Desulfomonilaceae bacterium]
MESVIRQLDWECGALIASQADARLRVGSTRPAISEEDWEDIGAGLNGDGDAYARLVRRHQSRVASRMWRFTRDAIDHEDLVQEVFVQAYLGLHNYRGDAPFEHWLARIATRVGYRFWKSNARNRSIQSVPIEDLANVLSSDPQATDPQDAGRTLYELMEMLPPRDRLVLALRYVEDRSVEETARLTGWTQTMVKVQAWRARKKLRKLLKEAGMELDR